MHKIYILKVSWGIKITALYSGFVLLIGTMVWASTRQHFDLVSDTYYSDEIKYQDVINAGRNQAGLSHAIALHADENTVSIELPEELRRQPLSGSIYFYSAVNAAWDKVIPAGSIAGNMQVPRAELHKTHYTVKIELEAGGKKYYQESGLDLSK